jgi:thiamine biosynthesis lipoprotein
VNTHPYRFQAIGTSWTISTTPPLDTGTLARIQRTVEEFDLTYSRFRPDSDISQFARAAGSQALPDTAAPLFAFYRQLYEITEGQVSPLVGRALEHLGYDSNYSLRRRSGQVSVPLWDDVLTVAGSVLTATEPVLLDVGAAGKGYLVDLLAEKLAQHGYREFLIDASGDIAHCGPETCRVGLEHPADPGQVIGVANLQNASLCGSAVNRRSWGEGLHHIIDPVTGESTTDVLATWVVVDRSISIDGNATSHSTMVADGLATALFFTEPSILANQFDFSYVRMLATGGVEYSINFDGELFT